MTSALKFLSLSPIFFLFKINFYLFSIEELKGRVKINQIKKRPVKE